MSVRRISGGGAGGMSGGAGRDFMATALRVPSTPPSFASLLPLPLSFLPSTLSSLRIPPSPLCLFPLRLPPPFSLLLTNVFLSALGSRGLVQGEMRDIAVQTANYSAGHVGTFGISDFEQIPSP